MPSVRRSTPADHAAIVALLTSSWGEPRVLAHGREWDASVLPALIVEGESTIVGLLTYEVIGDECEVVSIDAVRPHEGIGTVLLDAMVQLARGSGWRRIVLTTTNDNLDALRFYQRRGFRLRALRPGAVDASRRRKAAIPDLGAYGIPLRDELDLEMTVEPTGHPPAG